jgi:hypothetical protein
VRRGAVDADHARARLAAQRVGAEALAVGHVPDLDLLVRQDVRQLQQLRDGF